MKKGDIATIVRIKVKISFWGALKLRLAGICPELIEDIFKSEKQYKEENEPVRGEELIKRLTKELKECEEGK